MYWLAIGNGTMTSVSYTHLDVYKRQTLRHSLPGTDYVRYIERTLKALYEDGIIAGNDLKRMEMPSDDSKIIFSYIGFAPVTYSAKEMNKLSEVVLVEDTKTIESGLSFPNAIHSCFQSPSTM